MSKTILITGANKGIGYELARVLIESGSEYRKIIVTARNESLGLEAVRRLGGGDRLDFHVLDITNSQSIDEIKEFVTSKYGHLDTLVNNAGVIFKDAENVYSVIKPTISTNTLGAIHLTEALLPIISEGGYILNVSAGLGTSAWLDDPAFFERIYNENLSIEGLKQIVAEIYNLGEAQQGWNLNPWTVYGYSKALLNAYTLLLSKELAPRRITVNAVCPGWVRTDMGGSEAHIPLEQGGLRPFKALTEANALTGMFFEGGTWKNLR